MSDDLLDLTSSPDPRKNYTFDGDSSKSRPSSKTAVKQAVSYLDPCDEDDDFFPSISAASKKPSGKKSAERDEEKRDRDEAKKVSAEAAKRRKEQALEDKRIQKEMMQDEKRREKERVQHEKEAKNDERRVAAEMSGRFKDSEVSMVIEESLYNSEEGLLIIENLKQQSAERGDKEKPIQFLSARSRIPNLIRWTYRSKGDGGGCNINEPKSRVMEFIVLLLSPAEFVNLVVQTTDFVDFSALGQSMDDIRTRASQTEGCPPGSRLTILLNDLDKEVNRLARSKSNATSISGLQSTLAAIDGAEAYLIAEKSVDIWKAKSLAEVAEYLKSVTQQLAEAIYREPTTELECVAKKSIKGLDGLSGREKELHEMRETWINMLQTIPGISEAAARHLASHYSCPRKLLDAYKSKTLTIEEKKNLLANKFSTAKAERRKLSRQVYEIMTSLDPELSIDSVT